MKDKLTEAINRSGYKRKFISMKLGISYAVFVKKASGEIQWKADEMAALKVLLNLSNDEVVDIFLGES